MLENLLLLDLVCKISFCINLNKIYAAIVRDFHAAIAPFIFLYKNGKIVLKTVILFHLLWAK